MAYFERADTATFRPTHHVGGAWKTDEQHIAPAFGLLTHVVELDRVARGRDDAAVARLAFDIWGPIPLEPLSASVGVLRTGRSVELVEATLTHRDRPAVTARAWLLAPSDTHDLAATDLPAVAGPESMPRWDPSEDWPGEFVRTIEIRRDRHGPGRSVFWARPLEPLLEGEDVSPLARAAGLLDITNGMTVRADPREVAFPNVDLTAHLFRQPADGWLGFDTSVSFGAAGAGVTSSVLHDSRGPWGTSAQSLLVRRL